MKNFFKQNPYRDWDFLATSGFLILLCLVAGFGWAFLKITAVPKLSAEATIAKSLKKIDQPTILATIEAIVNRQEIFQAILATTTVLADPSR